MNLKYNLKLHQYNPYNDRHYLNSPIKAMTPKRSRAIEEQQSFKKIFTQFAKPCSRCYSAQATLSCNQCRNQFLCQNCDIKLHLKGKFTLHQRDSIKQTSIEDKIGQSIENNAKKQNKQFQNELKKSGILNINQLWDSISSEISQKFRILSDLIKDRKKQILQKIEKRREQEIRQFQMFYNNPESETAIQGSQNISNLNYGLNIGTKVQSLGNQQFDHKCEKKYKTSLGIFQEIQSLVQKIEMKNLLIKNTEDLQPTSKKPMKRSMVFLSPSANYNLSPYTRTPGHTKSQLSQSTVEVSPMELALKLTQEAKKKSEVEKQPKLLAKVRSEKLFCKSPTAGSQKYINKEKTTVKKTQKTGQ